jgi:exosome complex exonuclease DIS3/RRP44
MVSGAPHQHLLIVDTNVALHQIDVLEYNCPATSLVVILQTVLQELRHLNLPVYRRLNSLIQDESRSYIFFPNEQVADTAVSRMRDESMNDFNDRSIRTTVKYFSDMIVEGADAESCRAVLLSNDADNLVRHRAFHFLLLIVICRNAHKMIIYSR